MPPPCPACAEAASRPVCGSYRMDCLECCARLVLSTHPDKNLAEAMLAAIARVTGSPSRADVLACVGRTLTKRRSAALKSGADSCAV